MSEEPSPSSAPEPLPPPRDPMQEETKSLDPSGNERMLIDLDTKEIRPLDR